MFAEAQRVARYAVRAWQNFLFETGNVLVELYGFFDVFGGEDDVIEAIREGFPLRSFWVQNVQIVQALRSVQAVWNARDTTCTRTLALAKFERVFSA